ncbi:dihydropteroate synthase [Desulfobacterota bacterium M19]
MKLTIRGHNLDLSPGAGRIMGIINVTPDSFSDGGEFTTTDAIASQGRQMLEAGVDIIDIGGESSRPFAKPVELQEELSRVIPAIKILRSQSSTIPISIDTTKAEVARQAIKAGADIINDISALRFDADMLEVARSQAAPIIIMHMQGRPENMQVNPVYNDIIQDTLHFFRKRLKWLTANGIAPEKIIIDPGIGFGKSLRHNLTILNRLQDYQELGCPVLIGHSRKSFMTGVSGENIDRDCATAVIAALCVERGAAVIRVHNVKKSKEAVRLTQAIQTI